MEYNELKNKIKIQIEKNKILSKQTHIMFIPLFHKKENDNGEEKIVQYGIDEVYNDFMFK